MLKPRAWAAVRAQTNPKPRPNPNPKPLLSGGNRKARARNAPGPRVTRGSFKLRLPLSPAGQDSGQAPSLWGAMVSAYPCDGLSKENRMGNPRNTWFWLSVFRLRFERLAAVDGHARHRQVHAVCKVRFRAAGIRGMGARPHPGNAVTGSGSKGP